MIQKIHVGVLDLKDAAIVTHDIDNVLERQQTLTLNLRIDVLSFGAKCEKFDEIDVIVQFAVLFVVALHQLDESLEALRVAVEDENVVAAVHELAHDHVLDFAQVRLLRFDDRLKELEIDDATIFADRLDHVLDDRFRHLLTEIGIVEKYGAHRFRFNYLKERNI